MASAVIHLAIAKELEKYLNIENKKDYYLGAIAPDLSKQIGKNKIESHFLYNTKYDIPNINLFTNKYKNFKENSFELGYFIHLYTDKIWFSEFIEKLTYSNSVKLLDGTIINTTKEEIKNLIYNDYTNLNIELIDTYNLDLSLFYEPFSPPTTKMTELPLDKLNILIDQMGIIIENSKQVKSYIFDITIINNFISTCTKEIIDKLKEY
ncbi:MAG: zinc dependent phospholipase C family protein [bacterium]|nr:zinc dependent phospholipase C family protein [bacterium]